jgi:conserved oligomeric Golgi complex subunit 1
MMAGNAHYNLSNSEKSIQIKINQIFEKNNIAAIKNIDKQSKQDVEKKKYELRMLVGNRYRDLIDSADSILEMKASSSSIANHLQNIEGSCIELQNLMKDVFENAPQHSNSNNIIFINNNNPHNTANSKEGEVVEIAKKVKELVDTPEKIWVSLEKQEFLNASQLYLSAQTTHDILLQSSSSRKLIVRYSL